MQVYKFNETKTQIVLHAILQLTDTMIEHKQKKTIFI